MGDRLLEGRDYTPVHMSSENRKDVFVRVREKWISLFKDNKAIWIKNVIMMCTAKLFIINTVTLKQLKIAVWSWKDQVLRCIQNAIQTTVNLVVQFSYVKFTPHKRLMSELTSPVYTNTNVRFKWNYSQPVASCKKWPCFKEAKLNCSNVPKQTWEIYCCNKIYIRRF